MFQKAGGRCKPVHALKRITFQESLAVIAIRPLAYMPRDFFYFLSYPEEIINYTC